MRDRRPSLCLRKARVHVINLILLSRSHTHPTSHQMGREIAQARPILVQSPAAGSRGIWSWSTNPLVAAAAAAASPYLSAGRKRAVQPKERPQHDAYPTCLLILLLPAKLVKLVPKGSANASGNLAYRADTAHRSFRRGIRRCADRTISVGTLKLPYKRYFPLLRILPSYL